MGNVLRLHLVGCIIFGTLFSGIPLQASDPAHIKSWQKQYFLDKNLGQEYLTILAAYIADLSQTRPDEIKKYLQNEVSAAMKAASSIKASDKVPNSFRLALIKVFKNAYCQAYKDTLKIEQAKKSQLAALLARRKQRGELKKAALDKQNSAPTQAEAPAEVDPDECKNDGDDLEVNKDEAAKMDRCAWKQALNNYYSTIYSLLDDQHKTFVYGYRRGKTLPVPKKVKMVDPVDPCKDIT